MSSSAPSQAALQACSRFLDIRRSIDAGTNSFEHDLDRARVLRRASVTLISEAGAMPIVESDGQMSFDFG